jgi:hypothetical protein
MLRAPSEAWSQPKVGRVSFSVQAPDVSVDNIFEAALRAGRGKDNDRSKPRSRFHILRAVNELPPQACKSA